jgi:hypothetical protein
MSNKNKKLSKKQKRIYSRLITKKLESMGIRDEITMHPSGKKQKQLVPKEDGTGFEVDESGALKVVDKDVLVAKNLQRNMVKNLRNSTKDIIESFLKINLPEKSEP